MEIRRQIVKNLEKNYGYTQYIYKHNVVLGGFIYLLNQVVFLGIHIKKKISPNNIYQYIVVHSYLFLQPLLLAGGGGKWGHSLIGKTATLQVVISGSSPDVSNFILITRFILIFFSGF